MRSKKFLKTAMTCMVVLSLVLGMTVTSFASLSVTYSGSFTENWMDRVTKSTSAGKAYLDYGFDKTLINEDIAYSLYYGDEHYAKIKNGNGTTRASSADAGDYSELEIRHAGSSVTYYSIW